MLYIVCVCVCVCVLTFMWIEYIYIFLYIRYQFSFSFPIFIIDLPYNHNPDYYICCSHCLFLQPIQFFSNILKITFPFSLHFLLLLLYATIYLNLLQYSINIHIIICSSFIIMFSMVLLNLMNKILPIKKEKKMINDDFYIAGI